MLVHTLVNGGVLNEKFKASSICQTTECLIQSGCIEFFEFYGGDMGPKIDEEKCKTDKEAFESHSLCWQKNDEILKKVNTHMRHGFHTGYWLVSNDSKRVEQNTNNRPYLAIQNCLQKDPHACDLDLMPGGSIIQYYPPIYGDFVVTWKQGVVKGDNDVATSVVTLKVCDVQDMLDGTKSDVELHHVFKTVTTDIEEHKFTPKWSEIVHHMTLNENNENNKIKGRNRMLEFKMSNVGFNKYSAYVDDVSLMLCPENYWNAIKTQNKRSILSKNESVEKEKREGNTGTDGNGDEDCEQYNHGIICLCHKKKNEIGYKKICISYANLKSYLKLGDFRPGTSRNGVHYDCECNSDDNGPINGNTSNGDDDDDDDDDINQPQPNSEPEPEQPEPVPEPEPVESPCTYTEEEEDGKVCLCKRKGEVRELKCVKPKYLEKYLESGAFYPGTVKDGQLYDCECKPCDELPPLPPKTPPGHTPPEASCQEHRLEFVCRDFTSEHPDMLHLDTGLDIEIVKRKLNTTCRDPKWNDKGADSNPSVTNKANFDEWFRDSSSMVKKKIVKISPTGQYKYGGPDFFPFDGDHNDVNQNHNYYFTCEHHNVFKYNDSANQYIKYKTNDDGWLFIDNKLQIDLGGTHGDESGIIWLDSLSLKDKDSYRLDIFFANRYPTESTMFIETNICLDCKHGYDDCHICAGNNDKDCCPEPTPPCNDKDGPCSDDNIQNDTIISTFEKNIKCKATLISPKTYEFEIKVEVEYPYNQPSSVILGLNPYNDNIRSRGSCSNLLDNAADAWGDDNTLWNPDRVTNVMNWTLESTFSSHYSKILTYKITTTAEDLLYCSDPVGDLGLVVRTEEPQNSSKYVYDGTWYITRSTPIDLTNEQEGEYPIYTSECSFRIKEINKGINSITYYVGDGYDDAHGVKLHIATTWVKEFCCNDDSVSFIIRTCVHVTSGNGKWAKLSNPHILFDGHPSDGFEIIALGTEDDETCTLSAECWHCCQKWLISGIPGNMKPPISGRLSIEWDALIFNTQYIPDEKHIPCLKKEVHGCFFFNIGDGCETLDTLRLQDKVEGELELYATPEMDDEWDYEEDGAFKDCDRIYLSLVPTLTSDICSKYNITVLEVSFEEKNCHGEHGGGAGDSVIVYRQGSPHVNQIFNSTVLNKPNGDCFSKISWIIKRMSKKTHGHPDQPLLHDDDKKRSKNKKHQKKNNDCETELTVTWELIPLNKPTNVLAKRNIIQSTLKRNLNPPRAIANQKRYADDDYPDGNYDIHSHAYSKQCKKIIFTTCNGHQNWDHHEGRCVNKGFKRWFPDHQDDWWWGIFAFMTLMAILLFIPFLLVPCLGLGKSQCGYGHRFYLNPWKKYIYKPWIKQPWRNFTSYETKERCSDECVDADLTRNACPGSSDILNRDVRNRSIINFSVDENDPKFK